MLFSKSRADLFGKIVKRIESNDYSGGICRHFIVKIISRPCESHLLFICGSYIKAAVAQIIKIPVSSVIMRTKSPHPTVDMPLKGKHLRHSYMPKPEVQPVFVGYLRRCDDFHFQIFHRVLLGRCEFFPGVETCLYAVPPEGFHQVKEALGGNCSKACQRQKRNLEIKGLLP